MAATVGRTAVGTPLNGTVEIAGPEVAPFDDFIRRALHDAGDPREVVVDPNATYFGAALSERSLVPDEGAAVLGELRFSDWLKQQS